MEYGLGAQAGPTPGGLDFAATRQRIFELEARFNQHDAELRQQGENR